MGSKYILVHACSLALTARGRVPQQPADLPVHEQGDWQKTQSVLSTYVQLSYSLRRLQGAQRVIRIWRTIHICLASLALIVISYHAIMELLTNVFHILAQSG